MNILAFCCALDKTYLALKYNEKIYDKIIKSDENYHSLYLISEIKSIFSKNSFEFKNLDFIALNCGPGSFTGIRAALSIAKVLAGELNKPLVCLDTAKILLTVYKCDKLIMDARRDMYFLGTKENIELVLKEKIFEKITAEDKILTDKNSFDNFREYNNVICFEIENKNIALAIMDLAEKRYNTAPDKSEFNYVNAKANYIQTPPVF